MKPPVPLAPFQTVFTNPDTMTPQEPLSSPSLKGFLIHSLSEKYSSPVQVVMGRKRGAAPRGVNLALRIDGPPPQVGASPCVGSCRAVLCGLSHSKHSCVSLLVYAFV